MGAGHRWQRRGKNHPAAPADRAGAPGRRRGVLAGRAAALGYAEALTRSSDPEDNRRGGELLRRLVSRDHTDIRVLSLYAFNAFEQQRFGEAVAAWEMMLKLLPAGDARRAVIERSIRLAQEK